MQGKYTESFDGCKIYYEMSLAKSRKPCLVFLHGISGNCTVWKHQMEFFGSKKYPVLAVDLCGHGNSHKENHSSRYTIDNLARDVHAILKHEQIKDYVFVGHSLGGMVALAYDRLYPGKAKAFVLIATPASNPLKYQVVPHLDKLTFLFTGGAKAAAKAVSVIKRSKYPYIDYSRLSSCNALTMLFHDLRCTPANVYFRLAAELFCFDITGHIPKIKRPMLLVTGDRDRALLKQALIDIDRVAKDSELVVMKRTDHLNPIRRPHELGKIIDTFLEKIGQGKKAVNR
jgi:3-oxoadipate enol-lactonase